MSILTKLSKTIGLFRGLFLPFGLFAIVAVGIHAGSDCVDNHAFSLYNFFDARFDELLTWLIVRVYGFMDVGVQLTATHTFKAVDFIDLDVKDAAARWTALLVELGADLIFAFPIFRHRPDGTPLVEFARRTYQDPTVLRVAAPLGAIFASIAGVLVIAREIQVATHGMLAGQPVQISQFGTQAAAIAGIIALVLVTWRLGGNALGAAARWADRRAKIDRERFSTPRRRKMRGLVTAGIILPITFLAVFQATPIIPTLRALWPL